MSDDFLPSLFRRPRVKPGRYVGVTTAVEKRSYRGARDYLMVSFDLFESAEALGNGEQVAHDVPAFFNIVKAGSLSKYGRLLALVFPDGGAPGRFSDLIGKALEVEVVTVEIDGSQAALPEASHYSRVSEVLGRV